MITKKTKTYSFLSLLFFIVAFSAYILLWQQVRNEGEKLLERSKEIADFNAREQTYRDLKKLVDSTKTDRDELNTYFLTEEKTIDFLSTIEKIAGEQGVDLVTDSLKVEEGTDLFDTLVISYSVEGVPERVNAILLILETLPYHASVSNVFLQSLFEEGVERTRGSIELTINLLNYDR